MPESSLFLGMDISALGMAAERRRMDVASENLAHAGDTLPVKDGLPYARKRVLFKTLVDRLGQQTGAVGSQVVDNPRYLRRHDPSHPHADPKTGQVVEADISPVLELTDLMLASKAYAANANAARSFIRMHESALRIAER